MPESSSTLLEQINSYLYAQLDEQIEAARSIHPRYEIMWTNLSGIVRAGGKRLRPQLLLTTYRALGGGSVETVLPVAAALELFHISILIHDDIIDRDDVRHGVDNLVGIYKKLYRALLRNDSDRQHFSESAALLAGDALLSKAYALIAIADMPEETRKEVIATFYDAVFQVAGGELLDTENSFLPADTIDADIIIQHKTASYSFVNPMIMGAQLASANDHTKDLLKTLGANLGTAFQLQDDYQSIFVSEQRTGKPAFGDLREGKRTYLIELFYNQANKEQIKLFESLFGSADLTDEQAQTLQDVLQSSGAVKTMQQKIANHAATARSILSQLSFDAEANDFYESLITISTEGAHS